jgi:hypothetical protein
MDMDFDNTSLAKHYGILASKLDISPMVVGPQQHKIRNADDAMAYYSSNGSMRNFGGRMMYKNTRAILEILLRDKPESLERYQKPDLATEVNRMAKEL